MTPTALGCASVRECPRRGRDGQAERLPTGHEDVLTAVVVGPGTNRKLDQ